MTAVIRTLAMALALASTAGVALAQATPPAAATVASPATATPTDAKAPAGPPAGFTAPADPRPEESNAERARSQPGNNAPFWRAVRESGNQQGITSLPGAEKGVLVQQFVQYPGSRLTNAGDAWRQVRNNWILPYGGALLAITALAIALFYWRKGPLGGHSTDTGRVIERFTYFERAAHWSNAIAFCVLAISGLVMAFGKYILLPVMGGTLFGWLTYALKNMHNFAGPVFAVSLVVVFVTFVRDNLPKAHDLTWLLKGGGILSGHEVPSDRFNAGEKVVFWFGVFLLGAIVIASGFVLDKIVPGLAYLRGDMQIAHMVHAIAAMFMMLMFMGHIYIGTVGMKDAYKAMKTGYVDEAWAKEHHELWYDDIKKGKIPAQRTPVATPSGDAVPASR